MIFIQHDKGKAIRNHKENEQTKSYKKHTTNNFVEIYKRTYSNFESLSLKWYRINKIGVESLLGPIRVY